MTDEKIVEAILSKNEKGLEELINRYENYIFTIAKNIMSGKSNEDIQEAMNDIYMTIWKNIACYDPKKGSLKNWIIGVTRYRTIDYLRRSNKLDFISKNIENRKEETSSIEDDYINNEQLNELITSMMSQLNERDKKIFVMKFINGETFDDIAYALKIDKSNLYNRISRMKNKIRLNVEV